jgi:hypothetical protein
MSQSANVDEVVNRRTRHAKLIMKDLESLNVPAAIGGSLALFVLKIGREVPPSNIDLIIQAEDGLSVRQDLLTTFPAKYTILSNTIFFSPPNSTEEKSMVQFLCSGKAVALAWLRFDYWERTITIDSTRALGLETCLVSKLSACNTPLRTLRVDRYGKGEQDRKCVMAIATVVQERGEVVCKDMVMRGALSALEFFNDHQKQVLRVVGVFDG